MVRRIRYFLICTCNYSMEDHDVIWFPCHNMCVYFTYETESDVILLGFLVIWWWLLALCICCCIARHLFPVVFSNLMKLPYFVVFTCVFSRESISFDARIVASCVRLPAFYGQKLTIITRCRCVCVCECSLKFSKKHHAVIGNR